MGFAAALSGPAALGGVWALQETMLHVTRISRDCNTLPKKAPLRRFAARKRERAGVAKLARSDRPIAA